MAVCGIGTAQRAGLTVPRDMSVVGYDNLPLGSWLHPRLTTVDQQVQRVGAAAARMLLALCGEDVEEPALTGRPRLVVRESTGPAPGGPDRPD
jgi:DNA-binding LacI/PurR family transcriptional regulator